MKGRHLRDAEKADWLVGDALSTASAVHLESCDRCRGELRQARDVLHRVSMDRVPDPGPAFWAGFSRRVARRAREEQPSRRIALWRALLPASLAAALAMVLVASVAHWPAHSSLPGEDAAAGEWTPLPAPQSDEAFQFLEVIAATEETWDDDAPCWMGECLADLSDAEARSVKQWFQAHVGRES